MPPPSNGLRDVARPVTESGEKRVRSQQSRKQVVSVIAIAILVTIATFMVVSGSSAGQEKAPQATLTLTTRIRGPAPGTLPSQVAYFRVGFPSDDITFTIMLTDTERIKEARDIVSGVQTDTVHVKGTIVKTPAHYNPPWSYHLAPESIQFFGAAAEVCDAHPVEVEEQLDEVCGAFLPGCVWCPWSSNVITEVYIFKAFLPLILADAPADV